MLNRPTSSTTRAEPGPARLAGRKAFVTGGDSGIGRAAAIAFVQEDTDVAIGHLPFEVADAKEVSALVRAEGSKAVAVPSDIRERASCHGMVATVAREFGGLDFPMNDAGARQSVSDLAVLTAERFDTTFETDVHAPFWITKAGLPHPQARRVHHHGIGPGAQSVGHPVRLFPDKDGERRLHQVGRWATRVEGHPGGHGGAGPVPDGPAVQRRADAGAAG